MGSDGVIATISALDYLFVPIKADRLVLESTLNFATTVNDRLIKTGISNLKALCMFWNMVDRRERTVLYDIYQQGFSLLGLDCLKTRIPVRSNFTKDLAITGGPVYRSTLFAPDAGFTRSLMAGSPPERVTPSVPQKGETDRETAEETKTEFEAEEMPEKAASKTLKAALAEFMRRFLTPYKCEGRQGVYIDKELHQKISVIVGIAGKRQLTVGNYIDNVLREHFEKHSDEVKAYCQKSYNKIF